MLMNQHNFWAVCDRGFLPAVDPDHIRLRKNSLNAKHKVLNEFACILEELFSNLPYYMEQGYVREELVSTLRPIDINFLNEVSLEDEIHVLERLLMLYSYFGSFYVHCTENASKRLPREIAVPLVELANKLQRKPILSYSNYCLTNWRRIDKNKPIELGNIELLQHFKNGDGEKDESWFILVHVDIENKASPALGSICGYLNSCCAESCKDYLVEALESTADSLKNINATMNRMEEHCGTDVYFNKVRPYIFGFDKVVYEGVSSNLVTHRGETGAQSSVIPAFIEFLGIKHKQSILTEHLEDMKNYMPVPHRRFLNNLNFKLAIYRNKANNKVRSLVLADKSLFDTYNECIKGVIDFRKKHFEYAVNYIQKKVDNPKGTGGTPYIEWLGQLIKETEDYYV